MTQWVERTTGGRSRGIRALAAAWVDVMTSPKRFFRTTVTPGDQAPGLLFVMGVVLVEEATRFLLVPGVTPTFANAPIASAIFVLGLSVLLVAPAALHLVAAVQTLLLIAFVEDRAGVSETVQVVAYAVAPCVFAGVPHPAVRVICALYGAILLALGISIRHTVSFPRAILLTVVPNALVFGYGFRGFAAMETLLAAA